MTNQESKQQQYPQNYPPYEDEINLIDYLRVLWKWKWLIVAGTLICAVVAAVISLRMPEIYEVSTVIEPGIIGVDNSGNYTYMNSKNISGKINEGAYNKSIKKLLNIDPSKTNLEFKAGVGKFTNQIRISAEYKGKDVDLGLEASRKLIAIISDDYKKVVEQRKNDYNRQIAEKQNEISKVEYIETQERKDIDEQILLKQNEISKIETQERKDIDKQILLKQNEIRKTEIQWRRDTDKQVTLKLNNIERKRNQIKLQQEILEIARQRIKELELEAKRNKNNTEKIVKQREILLKDNRAKDALFLLLYATTIQQNEAYLIRLSNQIYNLRANLQAKEANIEELKVDTGFIATEIEELKLRRAEGLQSKIDNIRSEIEKLKLRRAEGLQAKIDNIKAEIEELKLPRAEGLQAKIDNIKTQISTLISEKGNISNIKTIQNPEVSSASVKSKKKQIVLLSVVVGLFFMIFLVFFVEYIKNASKASSAK